METEYLKMKCLKCKYEEWAEADIACEIATYNQKTKKHEILLLCPKCEGTMIWHNKETKIEEWNDDLCINPKDLPF